jgi:hypothetical protein
VASISATGVVSGILAGTSTISYTLSTGCTATTIVTVNALPVVTGTAASCIGATSTLTGVAAGGLWTSANVGFATVGAATGVVTGVVAGIVYRL